MGGIFDSYSMQSIDLLKRASFGILVDLWGSLFLVKITFSFPFTMRCKHSTVHCVQSTRTQLRVLWRVIACSSHTIWKAKEILKRGRRRGKKYSFFAGGSCAIMQAISLPGRSDAVLISAARSSSVCVSTSTINSCSRWITAFPEGHRSPPCLCPGLPPPARPSDERKTISLLKRRKTVAVEERDGGAGSKKAGEESKSCVLSILSAAFK